MEYLRVHGVTVEIPPGLDDAARDAFCQAFVAETPADLTDEEKALHVELFLATHAPKPAPTPEPEPAPAAAPIARGVDTPTDEEG